MYFEKKVQIRLRNIDYERIEHIVKEDPETYDSVSHFVRCAVMKALRKK